MRKRFALFLIAVLLLTGLCVFARAEIVSSGACGESAAWTLDDAGVLTISGTGPVTSVSWNRLNVLHAIVLDGITQVKFSDHNKLKTVVLPESMTVIDGSAFSNCNSLTDVTLPSTVTAIRGWAFSKCTSLSSISIPDSVTSIGDAAFLGCSSLKSVRIPNGVPFLADFTFSGCTGLKSVVIPDSVKNIGGYAFNECKALTSVTVPVGVTGIEKGAFQDYNGEIRFAGDAPVIADGAFKGAYAICYFSPKKSGWDSVVRSTYQVAWVKWMVSGQSVPADAEKDASEALVSSKTSNKDSQEYVYYWDGGTVDSYLTPLGDGTYCRVEKSGDQIVVEQYSADFRLLWKKTLALELPKWGGYYHGTDYNFLVFGQTNPNEDDKKEVVRVVRYSQNWHRIDAAVITGKDIYDPFEYGTLRMTQSNDILYLHSSRLMYQDTAGVRHQSNMSFKIFIPTMDLIRGNDDTNINNDYASHSFNQFIVIDGDDVLELNHGDKYPRSLVLNRSGGTANQPGSVETSRKVYLLRFAYVSGRTYQDTGAQVGGFEISSSHYLVAGKSIDQTVGTGFRYNIFLATVPKDEFNNNAVKLDWFTDYKDDTPHVTNPQLVKVDADRFLLMWTEKPDAEAVAGSVLKCVLLDAGGNKLTNVLSANGWLSDCKPTLSGRKVCWYVTDCCQIVFYSIDLDQMVRTNHLSLNIEKTIASHTMVARSEKVEPTCTKDGVGATWYCTVCGRLYADEEGLLEITEPVPIPALGHTPDADAAAAQAVHCVRCGKLLNSWDLDPQPGRLPGDVNNDGEVDGRDAVRLMKYLAGDIDPETGLVWEILDKNADVTGDDAIDEKDLLRLVRYLSGEPVVLE